MKTLMLAAIIIITLGFALPSSAFAVHNARDIATAIVLRGQSCGGMTVSNIKETSDKAGNRTVTATCPNGQRYRIDVSHDGRMVITPIH